MADEVGVTVAPSVLSARVDGGLDSRLRGKDGLGPPAFLTQLPCPAGITVCPLPMRNLRYIFIRAELA